MPFYENFCKIVGVILIVMLVTLIFCIAYDLVLGL